MTAESSNKNGTIWQRYLDWYRHSLWCNWLCLPVATGLLLAPMADQTRYADVYDVISKSKTFTVYGSIRTVGVKRGKRIKIKTENETITALCSLLYSSGTSCIPDGFRDGDRDAIIELSTYKGRNIIISAVTKSGDVIIIKNSRFNGIKSDSEYASALGFRRNFINGSGFGLVFGSLPRHFFYIAPRRQKRKKGVSE